ncbi:MAG: efflux RND transporter periplasmic adaptor subunit [Candidatus Competibacteraceae bacterium]|nr:efflux RND transporter periplasmic adaptor subunit [Candidatus Competibacteraceae bacterium]
MKAVLALIAGMMIFAAGLYWGPRLPLSQMSAPAGETAAVESAEDERKPIKYRHPMNPTIFSDTPAKDDMGMDYIPVYADDGAGEDAALVRISPTLVHNLGVRTAPVSRGTLARQIDTVGYLGYDERGISHIHVRTPGWVENLRVRAVGERVEEGDLLFEFYSPDLVSAQQEYLLVLAQNNQRMLSSARDRLLALGLSRPELGNLERTRQVRQLTQVFARQDGVVSQLNIREGMYVRPDLEILTLADLSSIWVLVDVFERQADWLRPGQQVQVRIPYLPGETWQGQVEHIYPDLDPRTRTVRARLRFDNPGERLKPGMFADITIYADSREALSVPREALILSGEGARVMVARGEGRFEAVTVEPGIESGERVEIRQGLAEEDRVVVSAQFLLDSEASLKASLLRMSEPKPTKALIWAEGQVYEIRPDERKINMAHQPIPEIGWPEMVMDFAVAQGVDLEPLEVDDRIRFALMETDSGYLIERIEVQPALVGEGIINEVGTDRLNIWHQPIEALGWPEMTMDFALLPGVDVSTLKPDMAVRFELAQGEDGRYAIARIQEVAP